MLNKALFKKAIIFLLPIPLIVGEVLYLARESVQNNLNHLLEKKRSNRRRNFIPNRDRKPHGFVAS